MKFNSIAIWLDHSKAKLIAIDQGHLKITTVISPYNRHVRIKGQGTDISPYLHLFGSDREATKHHRLQNELEEYFTSLEKRLTGCNRILIMGPTNAKDQLENHLKKNKRFSVCNIQIKSTDYSTENEIVAIAKDYFMSVIKNAVEKV